MKRDFGIRDIGRKLVLRWRFRVRKVWSGIGGIGLRGILCMNEDVSKM